MYTEHVEEYASNDRKRFADIYYHRDQEYYSIRISDYQSHQGGHIRTDDYFDALRIAAGFVDNTVKFKFDYYEGLVLEE